MKRVKPETNAGFTLVEVLVASVILFSAMAAVALVYRGALLSSEKAGRQLETATVIPVALADIRDQIRKQGNEELTELTGKGLAWDVSYQWQASLNEFRPAAPLFDVDTGKYEIQPNKYKLWQVKMTLDNNGTMSEYTYEELSWNEK